MELPDPYYAFGALTGLGLFTQWILMVMNGSFMSMVQTSYRGVFPTGLPFKMAWTGVWPIDFTLGLLVAFFAAVDKMADLPDIGPFLMLADLILALVVCNLMTLVEDRRDRMMGFLRYPAFWQCLWNFCGAASILPIYSHLYLKKRPANSPRLESNQAQALPLTAIWSMICCLPLLLPAILGASSSQIQNGVIVWFFGPLSLGIFQDLASCLVSAVSFKMNGNPVIAAYCIVGGVSAIVHIGIAAFALLFSEITWSSIYLPNYGAVQPGSTVMTGGAMLFLQYGHIAIYLCVLVLGVYKSRPENVLAAKSSSKRLRTSRPMLTLMAITAVGGPGAGLAWLLCNNEREMDADNVLNKQS